MATDETKFKYSSTSVGRYLGKISVKTTRWGGIGPARVTLGCWQAVGPAREVFTKDVFPEVGEYLKQTDGRLQNSGSLVVISLFMVGRSEERTKPTVMIVSDDKAARQRAVAVIKQSGIMAKHAGFALSDASRAAEFAMIQPLAGQEGDQSTPNPQHQPDEVPLEPIRVWSRTSSTRQTIRGTRLSPSSASMALLGKIATAGEYIRYNNSYFLLTVDHFLFGDEVVTKPVARQPEAGLLDDEPDDDDCSIFGFDDFGPDATDFDEDQLVDITSRGSQTPESVASSQGSDDSSIATIECTASGPEDLNTSQVSTRSLAYTDAPGESMTAILEIGFVRARSQELDYCVIELNEDYWPRNEEALGAVDLDSRANIETAPRDASVVLQTASAGTLVGRMSGTPAFVQLPGSTVFREVYTVSIHGCLSPGDCGGSVRDFQTGKLFGHLVAGSQTTGVALVMPAHTVLENLWEQLGGHRRRLETMESGIAWTKALSDVFEPTPKGDTTPRESPSVLTGEASTAVPISANACYQPFRDTSRIQPAARHLATPSCDSCCSEEESKSRSLNPADIQNRIDNVEVLVLSLMQGGASPDLSAATIANNSASSRKQERNEDGFAREEGKGDREPSASRGLPRAADADQCHPHPLGHVARADESRVPVEGKSDSCLLCPSHQPPPPSMSPVVSPSQRRETGETTPTPSRRLQLCSEAVESTTAEKSPSLPIRGSMAWREQDKHPVKILEHKNSVALGYEPNRVNDGSTNQRAMDNFVDSKPAAQPLGAPKDPDSERFMVVGIDFGTTFSGVAWAIGNDVNKNINVITQWPGTSASSEKVPTTITYTSEGQSRWGYDVLRDDLKPIRWFKLLLASEEADEPPAGGVNHLSTAAEELKRIRKTAVEVVGDYLRHLWDHAKSCIENQAGAWSSRRWNDAKVVLTVPAIWSPRMRQKTYMAAHLAGLPPDIQLVGEPEAAALEISRQIRDRGGTDIRVGESFIVCDTGGGTVDIITYRVVQESPLRIEEAVCGEGQLRGASFLDSAFEEFFRDSGGRGGGRAMESDGSLLLADTSTCAELTRQAVDHIKPLVKNQIKALEKKVERAQLKALFVVGGPTMNASFRARLSSVLEADGIDIFWPLNSWTAIARGACLRALESSSMSGTKAHRTELDPTQLPIQMVASRISRYSFGIHAPADTSQIVWELGPPQTSDAVQETSKEVQWLLRRGDRVSDGDTFGFHTHFAAPHGQDSYGDHTGALTYEVIYSDTENPGQGDKILKLGDITADADSNPNETRLDGDNTYSQVLSLAFFVNIVGTALEFIMCSQLCDDLLRRRHVETQYSSDPLQHGYWEAQGRLLCI